MDNIKTLGKPSDRPRATRPGVVQITHANNDDAAASMDQGSVGALHGNGGISSLVRHESTEAPNQNSDRAAGGDVDPSGHGQVDEIVAALSLAAAATGEAPLSPDTNNNNDNRSGGEEENVEGSQNPLQQAEEPDLPCLLGEESIFDAEVALGSAGCDEQSASSIHLTQSSFPIAQVVDDLLFDDNDQEESEDQHDTDEDSEVLLDDSENIDYSEVILMRQEVALATTEGGDSPDAGNYDESRESSWREDYANFFRFISKQRSRRVTCGVIGVLVMIACVCGAVVAVNNSKNDIEGGITQNAEIDANSFSIDADTNVVEVLLQDFLMDVGTNEHKIPGTPQFRAIQWLYESAREGIERFNLSEWAIRQLLVQRYVLAVFYYGSEGWNDDCDFLTAKHECEWKCTKSSNGVTCNESNRIQKIVIPNNNLSGPIPEEFSALTSLEEVDLSDNNIWGQLPENMGDLRNLKSFNAAHNKLTGSLPPSFGNLSFLRSLNLMDNNLIGEIPPQVNRLGLLSNLWLNGNSFTGGMNNFCEGTNRLLFHRRRLRLRVSTFYADCPSIECDCCTHCCNSSSCQPNSYVPANL